MKIAFLTPFLPLPADTGGKIRTYQILRTLIAKHDVFILTLSNNTSQDSIRTLESSGASVFCFDGTFSNETRKFTGIPDHVSAFRDPVLFQRFQEQIEKIQPDLIFCDETVMADYVPNLPKVKRVLSIQNIDHFRSWDVFCNLPWGRNRAQWKRKAKALREYWRLRDYCRAIFRRPWDQVITCSEKDSSVVQKISTGLTTQIVPNGVDCDFYRMTPPKASNTYRLAFVGSMFYPPNIDGVLYFFDQIYPIVKKEIDPISVTIIGHHPPPEILALTKSHSEVVVTGSVPDVRDYLKEADTVIVPLRQGSGTSLKVLEAMASSRPVIATQVGSRGLDLRDGKDLLVAETAKAFAEALVDLRENPDRAKHISESALERVQRYDWSVLTSGLEQSLASLLNDSPST